jgi:tRNA G18 (ribose-2'-O)-methylase SpoU
LSDTNQKLSRKEYRDKALRRYEKERLRNKLASPGQHEFILILDNLKAGYNVPKLFRSAEAFGACEVHLINIGFFDPAAAKGAFRKVPASFHDNFSSCYQELINRGYQIFTLEPETDNLLHEIDLPKKSAFVLGHEELGINFDREDYPDIQPVTITQFGNVQSLNVSIAGSIIMFEYTRRLLSD